MCCFFLDVCFELPWSQVLTTCDVNLCTFEGVFSQHLSARGPEITVKQRYRLKKLLQICQRAERCALAFQTEVLTVCSSRSRYYSFSVLVSSNNKKCVV